MGNEAALHALREQEEQKQLARLSKEQLLKPRRVQEEIPLESLGGTVILRSLSHRQRQEIRQAAKWGTEKYDDERFTLMSIVASLVDPKLTVDDVEALRDQDVAVYDELVLHISTINLLGGASDLKKESSETPNSDSP